MNIGRTEIVWAIGLVLLVFSLIAWDPCLAALGLIITIPTATRHWIKNRR